MARARSAVRVIERSARTLTRRHAAVDPWFLGRWGMNLYRGCEHACLYCDGRAERYHVEGDFARDIVVKVNAPELLARELDRAPEPGLVFVGGGVSDAYQPIEERYQLARRCLEVIAARGLPVHVLTKSALAQRDFDLLQRIHERARVILSVSLHTLDDDLRARFEPRASSVEARLELLARGKELGFGVGLMAMPVLPGLSDKARQIDALIDRAAALGVDFVCFSGLTLRPGVQKQTYLDVLREHHPQLVEGVERVYRAGLRSGGADSRYYRRVDQRFRAALARHRLPGRVPHRLFRGLMPCYTELAVLLEHREFAEPALGRRRGLSRAGWAIQGWAKEQLTRRGRRRDFDWRVLEQEFRFRVADGSLGELRGMSASALALLPGLLRRVLARDETRSSERSRGLRSAPSPSDDTPRSARYEPSPEEGSDV